MTPAADPGHGGLKQQWGVGDPAGAPAAPGAAPAGGGSDHQAQAFQAAFQGRLAAINEHLQFTAAHAPASRHDPLAARRDALTGAFQSALAKIDRNDPSKAQADIDAVLGQAGVLAGDVAGFHTEIEQALQAWQAREGEHDAAIAQVEEIEAWRGASAPERAAFDAVLTCVNERRHADAVQALDAALAQLQPAWDDYQAQKEAQLQYDERRAALDERLATLQAAEQPSQPMQDQAAAASAALSAAAGQATASDYVAACESLDDAGTALDELAVLEQDTLRAQYLAERAQMTSTPNLDTGSDTQAEEWAAVEALLAQADEQAAAGDYAAATTTLADARSRITAMEAAHEQRQKDREAYETAAAEVEAPMQQVHACPLPGMAQDVATLTADYGRMNDLAAAEDYAGALAAAQALQGAIAAFDTKAEAERESIRAYLDGGVEIARRDLEAHADSKAGTKSRIEAIIASIDAAADDAALVRAVADRDRLPALIDELKRVDETHARLDAAATPEERKAVVRGIPAGSPADLREMPLELRNLIAEELMKEPVSAEDGAYAGRLFQVHKDDPDHDAADKPARDAMIRAFLRNPKVDEYRANWPTMTPEQKQQALRELAEVPCGPDGWNTGMPQQMTFDDEPDARGHYHHDEDRINLNLKHFDSLDTALDVLTHEVGHKEQERLIRAYRSGELTPDHPSYEAARSLAAFRTYTELPPDKQSPHKIYRTSPPEGYLRSLRKEMQAAAPQAAPDD